MVAINSDRSGGSIVQRHRLPHDPQQRRHPLFSQTNIFIQKSNPPPDTWTKIIPEINPGISIPGKGYDIETIYSNPLIGAQNLLHECEISSPDALLHLHECLSLFQDVTPDATSYRARIVSFRGGSKCSKWHVDYVPVRLICALEGPGVCWLEGPGLCLLEGGCGSGRGVNEVNENEDVDKAIVTAVGKVVPERRCKRGDIAVLMGKEWEEECECCDDDEHDVVRAAVHKSPDLIPSQGRVLLTVDIDEPRARWYEMSPTVRGSYAGAVDLAKKWIAGW